MSWWWRTKPRSIIRTVQWFAHFAKLEGKNWNDEDPNTVSRFAGKKIHPVRRQYTYGAHGEEDQYIKDLTYREYLSGKKDRNETEGNARNDEATFHFFGFGYIADDGRVKVTKTGQRIVDGLFDSEDFLKQLLKLELPNISTINRAYHEGKHVFPMELVLKAIERFEYLNRSEIVILFGCERIEDLDKTLDGIEYFRSRYLSLPNKNDTAKVKNLTEEAYKRAHGHVENAIPSYYDYAEAFCRCLIYTGLFKASGRSYATKIRVPDYEKLNFRMILDGYKFEHRHFNTLDDYMEWFGNPESTRLPWDNVAARKQILNEKVVHIKALLADSDFATKYGGDPELDLADSLELAQTIINKEAPNLSDLKDTESMLVKFIVGAKEREYIKSIARTDKAREEILEKFDDILGADDMAALWLEVNTWKSLLSIEGDKVVKRNFQIEEDLSPKSFAPGIGNTPDMELYMDDCIIIPEVSLMTGVQQWEHEASSVIDHVLSFVKENSGKRVRGLFLSTSINPRTKWQFFILNKQSWLDAPVPVIPLTIRQYIEILKHIYANGLTITDFASLIEDIHGLAKNSDNYNDWFEASSKHIANWIGPSCLPTA